MKTNSQLCVDGFLLHDLHDGRAGARATFGRGVNSDGLLCRTCVLFPMDVDPGVKAQMEKKKTCNSVFQTRHQQ